MTFDVYISGFINNDSKFSKIPTSVKDKIISKTEIRAKKSSLKGAITQSDLEEMVIDEIIRIYGEK